jgi:hypothetical protein
MSVLRRNHHPVRAGETVPSRSTAKTFPEFLGDYVESVLGLDWRHSIGPPAEIADRYLGAAYCLFLLNHYSTLQDRLVQRLKTPQRFRAAHYQLIVAATLVQAGFKLTLDEDAEPATRTCVFSATSQHTGKQYRVVVGTREAEDDDAAHRNPIAQMLLYLSDALRIPAAEERLIFFDLATDADGDSSWPQTSTAHLQQLGHQDFAATGPAYVLISNMSLHPFGETPLTLSAFGLGLPDFNRPGAQRLIETYRQQRRHADAFRIIEAFAKSPDLPPAFDSTLASNQAETKPRPIIGKTYLFENIPNLPESVNGRLVATVTTVAVLETEKIEYIAVTDQTGQRYVLTEPMSDQLFADYKAHPETYFSRIQQIPRDIASRQDLFVFFMDSFSALNRATLLELLDVHLGATAFTEMNDEDLLAEYCEVLVAASTLFD